MSSENYMSGQANKKIVEGLGKVLAETFVLYFKTHTFHWNVEGPHFKPLHELFETQYTELWEATDEIAERIRALDSYAPTSLAGFLKDASLAEQAKILKADVMVKELANDNTKIVEVLYKVLREAEDAGDEVTVDMLIGRITVHEKAAWMLRSSVK
ncbi:MAG: Dps family protein [Pseudobdellovibrionaceae bacterium]